RSRTDKMVMLDIYKKPEQEVRYEKNNNIPKNQNTYKDSLALYNKGEAEYKNLLRILEENNLDTERLGIYPALDTDLISPTYKLKLELSGSGKENGESYSAYNTKDGGILKVKEGTELYNLLKTPINS